MTAKRLFLFVILGTIAGVTLCAVLLNSLAHKVRHVAQLKGNSAVAMSAPTMAEGRAGVAMDKLAVDSFMPVPQAAPTDTTQRIVIKNGSLTITVKEFQPAITQVTQIAQSNGGYVTNYAVSQDEGVPPIDVRAGEPMPLRQEFDGKVVLHPQLGMATVSLRVPADKLDATMAQLRSVGTNVVSESVTGDDVTDQFIDNQARLKNLQATEAQLQKFLNQAANTQDTLAVYNQLTSIRSQIDQLQGQINYLTQSAKLSQITVTMRQEQGTVVTNKITTWQPLIVAREAFNSLINAFQRVGDAVIWFIVFAPIWLPLVALGWYLYRRTRRSL